MSNMYRYMERREYMRKHKRRPARIIAGSNASVVHFRNLKGRERHVKELLKCSQGQHCDKEDRLLYDRGITSREFML